ncbi:ABC transporter permease [Rhodococcus sp. SJ-2]
MALRVAILVGFVLVWEFAVRLGWISPTLVGQPSGVAAAFVDYVTSNSGWESIRATFYAVVLSFFIGSGAGVVFGLILGFSRIMDDVLGAFLVPLNSIPRIALAPLFIAWFGLGMLSKVVMGVSVVFFILAETARSSVKSVDSEYLKMARVSGLSGRAILWKVVLPSSVPSIFGALRLALPYSLLGVIASEMIAARNGIGQDITLFSTSYQMNYVFALLILLAAAASLANAAFGKLEASLLRWK